MKGSFKQLQPFKLVKLLGDTPEAFYWVGFLLADGCFTSKGEELTLEISDEVHLLDFIKFLDSKYQINVIPRKSGTYRENNKKISIRDIYSIPVLMKKFDIKERKTYNPPDFERYSTFSDDLIFSLILGFIDGDGNVRQVKRNKDWIGYQITIENHASWITWHKFIEDWIYGPFGFKKNKSTYVRANNRGNSLISITRKEVILKIKSEIQRLNLPVLKRKWDYIK